MNIQAALTFQLPYCGKAAFDWWLDVGPFSGDELKEKWGLQ